MKKFEIMWQVMDAKGKPTGYVLATKEAACSEYEWDMIEVFGEPVVPKYTVRKVKIVPVRSK